MLPIPLFVQLRISQTTAESDLCGDLGRLSIPTLFVQGSRRQRPFAFGQRAAAMAHGSRFVGCPGAAHGVFITHAERFDREVMEFFRS